MARDKQYEDLMSAAEALLFVSDEPVSSAALAKILEIDLVEMDETLAMLAAEYKDENRGIQLREVAGGWRFYTHPAHHQLIERYIISWDTHRMSQAALEALAIIAYHQPVTRAGVNAVRGVNSEGVVSSLVEKGLVREMGRDKPGGAILYGTTRAFLERFGLKSTAELPPLEDFAPDEESRAYIRERLSGAGKSPDLQLDLEDDDEETQEAASELRTMFADGSFHSASADGPAAASDDGASEIATIIGEAMTEKAAFDSVIDDVEDAPHDEMSSDDEYAEDDEGDDETFDEDIQTIE